MAPPTWRTGFSLVSRPLVLTGVDQEALTTVVVEVQCTELSLVEGTKKLEPFYFFGPTYLSGHWVGLYVHI